MTPVELIILKALSRGANHGFGVALHIQEASGGLLAVEEGSLYPTLHRLERDGLLSSAWGVTEKGRKAKFYKLSPAGRQRLSRAEESWQETAKGVQKLLSYVS